MTARQATDADERLKELWRKINGYFFGHISEILIASGHTCLLFGMQKRMFPTYV